MSEKLKQDIERYIQNMPSLPTSVAKVMDICNNPQTSPADLNHVISLDPVLVGRVLKLINSAYYGLGQQVTSLVRAIIMLGLNTVKNLALSSAVMGTFASGKQNSPALNMEGFWRHSLCVGVAAKMLSKKRGIDAKQAEEYFTAGLLHDIGKISFNAVSGENYVAAVGLSDRERIPLWKAEEQSLGMDHCFSGKMIVQAWRLDGAVGDAIIHHHSYEHYEGAYRDILSSVIAANWFANITGIGFSGDRYPEKVESNVWEFLGINKDIFGDIEATVNQEIEKAEVFLNI